MPRLKLPEKRVQLLEQKAKLDAQLRALDAKAKLTARKEDTRRKVIAGALALEHMEQHPHDPVSIKLRELLTLYVEPHSRRLFPFLPSLVAAAEEVTERDSESEGAQAAA